MSTNKNASPTRWQNPNEARRKLPADPAATPLPGKVAKGRDYIGDAVAALGITPSPAKNTEALKTHGSTVAAIIIAQAIDRFGEKLIDAAAVSQYRRTP